MFAGTASAGPVEDRINKINTWFANEKAETVEFQKVKWQEVKSLQFLEKPGGYLELYFLVISEDSPRNFPGSEGIQYQLLRAVE